MLLDPAKQEKTGKILGDISRQHKALTEECKRLAEARRNKSPFQQKNIVSFMQRLEDYIEETSRQGKPLTCAGFVLASGISKTAYYDALAGKYDYITEEYRILNDIPLEATEHITEEGEVIPLITYREALEKCQLLIQQKLEENCYQNKGNPAGSIFGLKAQHGWKDDENRYNVGNLHQTLVIADKEKALEALQLLK